MLPMFDQKKNLCVLAVSSGKGGVGKSTLVVNLARGLAELGLRVGILDADVYGPSIGLLLPEDCPPRQLETGFKPAESDGIRMMSIDYFDAMEGGVALRAPIVDHVVTTFLNRVDWGELDYLLIDFPPGTGDIPITLLQNAGISYALVATLPSRVATLDVEKNIEMFLSMQTPILGIVENMSYLSGSMEVKPFGEGGGRDLAERYGLNLLAELPLDPEVNALMEKGGSPFEKLPDAPLTTKLRDPALQVHVDRLSCEKQRMGLKKIYTDSSKKGLTMEWEDGKSSRLTASAIELNCPCVRCQQRQKESLDLEIVEVEQISLHLLKFEFSAGCSRGRFSIDRLRDFASTFPYFQVKYFPNAAKSAHFRRCVP